MYEIPSFIAHDGEKRLVTDQYVIKICKK